MAKKYILWFLCLFVADMLFPSVVSKLKCPVFLAREMSGFGFTTSNIYPAVGAVGMWESQAAFWPDFSKPLREATLFVAFRGGVISTASV